ncbi:hypothetical protein TRSC58_07488 [Trypanosoma rangeli SC58]|uniref:Uncharacterized protein n=1 Tax=Trypanosoma rangeli SC58 TaxID=429131 RepID=A0A061IT21_TRYRA|nr:hypothetical protein TRSC58_07488 [Trypanosoma rangeli SC58]
MSFFVWLLPRFYFFFLLPFPPPPALLFSTLFYSFFDERRFGRRCGFKARQTKITKKNGREKHCYHDANVCEQRQ